MWYNYLGQVNITVGLLKDTGEEQVFKDKAAG